MIRHTAPATAPASLWSSIELALRDFGTLFAARPELDAGLAAAARDRARIHQTSRHWLMG